MIFNKEGVAFPDYQNREGRFFRYTEHHDVRQWEFCKKHFKATRVCVDFGGHVGTSALMFAPVFDTVYSFEPIPDLYECLEYNTKDIPNVTINNVAISDYNGNTTIHINPSNSGANMIESPETKKLIKSRWGNKDRTNFQEAGSIEVECRTIDSYNLADVDFIKIDTEGYNMEPLRGMIETLERCSPVIQLERGVPYFPDAQHFLEGLGYRLIKTIEMDDIFVK